MHSRSTLLCRAPHLEAVCDAARSAPVNAFPGIAMVWIGAVPVHLPTQWMAFDGTGELAQAVVRDAWWQFWAKPFRVFETRDARHLVCWHALRFEIGAGGVDASPTGVRMWREDTLGRQFSEPVEIALPELFRGLLGSRSRSLMEAGMRRCLRTQLQRRGLPLDVPSVFLDALAFRIESQLDARMDWPLASQELLLLALGSERLANLLVELSLPRERGLRWQRHVLALRVTAAAWPASEQRWLPFAVPMHQHGGGAACTPSDVAVWLRARGLSRQSQARIERLSPAITSKLASLMLDLRPRALREFVAAMNRFLALVAGAFSEARHAGTAPPDDDAVIRAVDWLAVDAAQAMRALPSHCQHLLTVCGTGRSDVHMPWAVSGKVEYAARRGFRPELQQDGERKLRIAYGERHLQMQFQGFEDAPVQVLPFAGHISLGVMDVHEFVHARATADVREVRHFCALVVREHLGSTYRAAEFERQLHEACDWFTRALPQPALEQLGSWQAIQRRVRQWHRDEVHPRALEEALANWPYGVPDEWTEWVMPTEVGGWRAVQIANRQSICAEGIELQHCVASYAGECAKATSVIFSIRRRDNDARYGTAQFRHNGQGWYLVQFRGVQNLELPAADTQEPEALRELLSRLAAKLEQVDFREARRA